MTLWRRILALFAQPDPLDVDSRIPDSTQPLSEEDRAAVLAPSTQPIYPPPKGIP